MAPPVAAPPVAAPEGLDRDRGADHTSELDVVVEERPPSRTRTSARAGRSPDNAVQRARELVEPLLGCRLNHRGVHRPQITGHVPSVSGRCS